MKILFVIELPQWIRESQIAAYHPQTNTVYVRQDKWYYLFHELTHWYGHKLDGWNHWIHYWLDASNCGGINNIIIWRIKWQKA